MPVDAMRMHAPCAPSQLRLVPLPDVVNVGRTDHARTTQAETGADVHRDTRARLR